MSGQYLSVGQDLVDAAEYENKAEVERWLNAGVPVDSLDRVGI